MRVRTLSLLIAIAIVGAWRVGHAEKVKTNQATKIYNHPGEQGKVLMKVKEGQAMTVLSRDGRWLKVRYQGRTGYVPRSKVELPEGDEIVRNTRRRPFVDGRGTKRGFGGEGGPEDRIGADATGDGDDDSTPAKGKATKSKDDDDDTGKKPTKSTKRKSSDDDDDGGSKKSSKASKDDEPDDEPTGKDDDDKGGEDNAQKAVHVTEKIKVYEEANNSSDVMFTADPSDDLFLDPDDPKATKGKYTLVSKKDGDIGYVLTDKLDLGSDEDSDAGDGRKRAIDLRGRIGFAIIQEGMSTPGGSTKPPDNFNLGTSSATLALGGRYVTPYGKKYFLGGEATLDIDKGIPGISYTNATTMQSSTIGFTLYNFNLRALGGYDLRGKRGTVVWGRLGYHYQSFQVADVTDPAKNTALLPSEILKGITFGGGVTIPKLTPKIGIGLSLDLMLIGTSLQQTKNLEDGANPSASGACFGGVFTYRWKPKMDLQATYDLNYASLSFGAPVMGSMRTHTGMSSSRADTMHTIAVGIVYGL
jgi:hypothetical protein